MSNAHFLKLYAVLLLIVLPLLLVFCFIPVFKPYNGLNVVSFIFFNVLCLAAYYFGKKSLKSPNKFLFNQLIMLNVIIKMFVSIGIIVIFHQFYNPQTNWFVLPFLIFYVIYTIFETYLLTNLVKLHS